MEGFKMVYPKCEKCNGSLELVKDVDVEYIQCLMCSKITEYKNTFTYTGKSSLVPDKYKKHINNLPPN